MDWTKYYEVLTRPVPFAVALVLLSATSFLLFASSSILDKLGLSHTVVAEYRPIVGLVFVFGASWIVVPTVIAIGKRGYQAWLTLDRLHALTSDERGILSRYVANEVRTQIFHDVPDIGAAEGLVQDGILYRPDMPHEEPVAVAYNIHEWALRYLSKNKELVGAAVSAETRWSGTKRRVMKILRAVGKLFAAVVLAYVGLMLASLVGGGMAGFLGAILHLSSKTIDSIVWAFPKIIFVGIPVWLFIWERRR